MNISCIKLVSGEELVGDVTNTLQGEVQISQPLMVVIMPTGQGSFQVGLAPYLPYTEEKTFVYRKESVILQFEPNLQMQNQYKEMTGQGIVIASPKIELVP